MSRTCLDCGAKVADDAAKCGECGADMQKIANALAKVQDPETRHPALEQLALYVAAIVSILGGVAGLVGGFYCFFVRLGENALLAVLSLALGVLALVCGYALYVLFRRTYES